MHYGEIYKYKNHLDHHLIKYEDLVVDQELTVRSICSYLGVTFEPEMLDYGKSHHTDNDLALWEVNASQSKVSKTLESVKKGR